MKKGKEIMIKKYKTKPVEIEAIEYDGNNIEQIKKFLGNNFIKKTKTIEMHIPCEESIFPVPVPYIAYYIRTLEGDMKISKGDYIIKGIEGEFYPCKPDVFKQKYELIKER